MLCVLPYQSIETNVKIFQILAARCCVCITILKRRSRPLQNVLEIPLHKNQIPPRVNSLISKMIHNQKSYKKECRIKTFQILDGCAKSCNAVMN